MDDIVHKEDMVENMKLSVKARMHQRQKPSINGVRQHPEFPSDIHGCFEISTNVFVASIGELVSIAPKKHCW